jgi:glycosyltransferase involved in cell wall biosynthesis
MILLKASRLVCDEIPDTIFYTAGKFWEKQYRTDLVEERVKLGMEKKFHFMKWIHDMDTFYRSGAIFASASTCESFGLVLLEAMNNGLPVVTTDSGGPSEIVVDGVTGYLVPVDDVEGLARKIIYLLKNPDIGDKMGVNGYHRVKELFSHEAFIERMGEILTMGGTCGVS